jgi:hypothetical protein
MHACDLTRAEASIQQAKLRWGERLAAQEQQRHIVARQVEFKHDVELFRLVEQRARTQRRGGQDEIGAGVLRLF